MVCGAWTIALKRPAPRVRIRNRKTDTYSLKIIRPNKEPEASVGGIPVNTCQTPLANSERHSNTKKKVPPFNIECKITQKPWIVQVLSPLTNAHKRLLTLYNTLYFNNIMQKSGGFDVPQQPHILPQTSQQLPSYKNKKSVPVFSNQHTSYM